MNIPPNGRGTLAVSLSLAGKTGLIGTVVGLRDTEGRTSRIRIETLIYPAIAFEPPVIFAQLDHGQSEVSVDFELIEHFRAQRSLPHITVDSLTDSSEQHLARTNSVTTLLEGKIIKRVTPHTVTIRPAPGTSKGAVILTAASASPPFEKRLRIAWKRLTPIYASPSRLAFFNSSSSDHPGEWTKDVVLRNSLATAMTLESATTDVQGITVVCSSLHQAQREHVIQIKVNSTHLSSAADYGKLVVKCAIAESPHSVSIPLLVSR